jgi:glycine cleavage system H protein
MEGFKYIDIFASKGIEYIIVLAFLAILIVFWRWMSKYGFVNTVKEKIKKGISLIDWFYINKEYFYHQGHSWAAPQSKDVVTVGVDDFTQKFLGKPSKISVPEIGSQVKQGEKGIQFQIDSKSIDILSPVEGEVIEINKEAIDNPELINKSPYSEGWLFKVRSPKIRNNLKNLLTGKIATAWMEETAEKISNTMTKDVGIVMQDGGVPISGFVKEISKDDWTELAQEYLLTKDV